MNHDGLVQSITIMIMMEKVINRMFEVMVVV